MILYSIAPGSRITIQEDNSYTSMIATDYMNFESADLVNNDDGFHFRFKETNYFANSEDVITLL